MDRWDERSMGALCRDAASWAETRCVDPSLSDRVDTAGHWHCFHEWSGRFAAILFDPQQLRLKAGCSAAYDRETDVLERPDVERIRLPVDLKGGHLLSPSCLVRRRHRFCRCSGPAACPVKGALLLTPGVGFKKKFRLIACHFVLFHDSGDAHHSVQPRLGIQRS